jgi:hypothetical protein
VRLDDVDGRDKPGHDAGAADVASPVSARDLQIPISRAHPNTATSCPRFPSREAFGRTAPCAAPARDAGVRNSSLSDRAAALRIPNAVALRPFRSSAQTRRPAVRSEATTPPHTIEARHSK